MWRPQTLRHGLGRPHTVCALPDSCRSAHTGFAPLSVLQAHFEHHGVNLTHQQEKLDLLATLGLDLYITGAMRWWHL